VVPRAERCTVRAIGFALGGDFGAIEEAGELVDVAFAGHWLDGFVVAAAEEDGKGTKGSHLVGEEIVPRHLLIVLFGKRVSSMFHGDQILIGLRHPAEIAEVPVKDVVFGFHFGCDSGHHEVSAVAAVTGDGEGPCDWRGWSGLRGLDGWGDLGSLT
jgi:hypothetical protein